MTTHYRLFVMCNIFFVLFFANVLNADCTWKTQHESGKTPVPWPSANQTVTFYVLRGVTSGWKAVFEDEVDNHTDKTMDKLGITTIKFKDGGETGWEDQTQPIPDNNTNEYGASYYHKPTAGGVTVYTYENNKIKEVDILMNTTGLTVGWDYPNGAHAWSALRHELGHCYGLPHSLSGSSLMNATMATGQILYPNPCDASAIDCLYNYVPSSCDPLQPIILVNQTVTREHNQIIVCWESGQEIGWLEYDILRSEDKMFDFQKINSEMIETVGDELTGARYDFLDQTADPTKSYTYIIRIHTLDGIIEEEPFYYQGSGKN